MTQTKKRFHLFATCDEECARAVAETASMLGISQAAALRWAAKEWVATSQRRVSALENSGGLPPPPMSVPKRGRPRKKTKPVAMVAGQDGPF